MPGRRGRFGAWSTAGVIAWSIGVATVGGAFAGFVASQTKGSPWRNPLFDLLAVIAVLAFTLLLGVGVMGLLAWLRPALRLPAPVIADLWKYAADGATAAAAMSSLDISLPGTDFVNKFGDREPWLRIVVLIACRPVGPDTDLQESWPCFQAFLDHETVRWLTGHVDDFAGSSWERWPSNRPSAINAVLAYEESMLAAARLELPDGRNYQGRSQCYAALTLHFESNRGAHLRHRHKNSDPIFWYCWIVRALKLPKAFAAFLSQELGLQISGDPRAQLGVRLEALHDLTDIINIEGLDALPGGIRKRQAIGYFIADPKGNVQMDAARQMVTQVLQYALQVDDPSSLDWSC